MLLVIGVACFWLNVFKFQVNGHCKLQQLEETVFVGLYILHLALF